VSQLRDALYTKAVWTGTVAQTEQDLALEQAAACEALGVAQACLESSPFHGRPRRRGLIVGSGRTLSALPACGRLATRGYGGAALVLLNALQPEGLTRLALDRDGLLALTSAVAAVDPLAAVQLLERNALLHLGTVIAPLGTGCDGEPALICQVEYEDGRSTTVEVPCGHLQVVPLGPGHRAKLRLEALGPFAFPPPASGPGPALGHGRARLRPAAKREGEIQVEGGEIGIILDGRGRPLALAGEIEEQRLKVQRWVQEISS
jgi:hypothetical protein